MLFRSNMGTTNVNERGTLEGDEMYPRGGEQYGYSVNIVTLTHSSITQPVKTELYKIARTSISFSQTDYQLHVCQEIIKVRE